MYYNILVLLIVYQFHCDGVCIVPDQYKIQVASRGCGIADGHWKYAFHELADSRTETCFLYERERVSTMCRPRHPRRAIRRALETPRNRARAVVLGVLRIVLGDRERLEDALLQEFSIPKILPPALSLVLMSLPR